PVDTFSTIYQRLADALDLLVAFAQFRLPPPTDATTLYYTFSTIAQTLAGALVVLGAFVLFRLAPLDTALNEALRRLRILDEDSKGRAPIAKTWKIVRKRGAAGLFASAYGKIAAELQFGEGKGIGDRLVYDAVPPAWRLRGAITWWLWPALIFTVID